MRIKVFEGLVDTKKNAGHVEAEMNKWLSERGREVEVVSLQTCTSAATENGGDVIGYFIVTILYRDNP